MAMNDRVSRFVAIVVLAGVVQAILYTVGHAPGWYVWSCAPANLALDMLVVLGMWQLGVWLGESTGHVGRTFVIAVAIILATAGTRHLFTGYLYYGNDDYRRAADWIRQSTHSSATVATPEIGYIGVYADRRIIDP